MQISSFLTKLFHFICFQGLPDQGLSSSTADSPGQGTLPVLSPRGQVFDQWELGKGPC